MNETVTRLFPLPTEERPLEGLYLAHDVRQHAEGLDRAYVYTNFVASLDGRIAIHSEATEREMTVSKAIANPRDWRLFQELGAQSDIMITSGRYLRDRAAGHAQEILQVDDPRFSDLRAWREARGLSPHPDLAIVSRSLRFPIPEVLTAEGRKVLIYTTADSDATRRQELEDEAGEVIIAGEEGVQGDQMIAHMTAMGYRMVYSTAGPLIFHLLMTGGVLDRLYLTIANRLLAGDDYVTIAEGELFQPPGGVTLNALYYDAHGLDGLGQLFASYDIAVLPQG